MNFSVDSPPTAERFLQMYSRSGLIQPDELRMLVDTLPSQVRHDTNKLAEHFVAIEALTHFQASKLLLGTWHGLVLGPFQILAPLGRGGMGAVYLARNTRARNVGKQGKGVSSTQSNDMPALVALKVLPPKRAKEEERTLARFLREMDMCGRVNHPHITRTFEAGDIQGIYYIAMEYIRGASLSQQVKASGPISAERAARFFSEVAAGLAHAHGKGLIHRDLKPSNLMVTPNGHAKILDLGLAMMIDEDLPHDKTIVGGQGYVVGSMDYIAPEQVDDPTQVDGRSDLYALGCTMFFALAGQPPFPGGTSVQKMQRHRKDFAQPLTDINPTVPAEFVRIIDKLMEKNPVRRYRSAEQVRDVLLPWAAGDPERPLDVDPMLSENEAVAQLEKERADDVPWWKDVPVISFEATAKHTAAPRTDSAIQGELDAAPSPIASDEQHPKNPLAFLVILVAAIILIALMELIRR